MKWIKNFLYSFYQKADKSDVINVKNQIDELRFSVGINSLMNIDGERFNDFEIKVFSQFGEDGLIQFILKKIQLPDNLHTFVEFGVENYQESNTRFLLEKDNWKGLVIDGSKDNISKINNHFKWWKYDLKAINSFITAENINSILEDNGVAGEIGLLSIDIDGNDYWVWDAISVINPIVIICEYNSIYGKDSTVTIPYSSNFIREKAHISKKYYGASLGALNLLAIRKGYTLIGTNKAGNNSFYIRNDYADKFEFQSVESCWRFAKFRETRNNQGNLISLNVDEFYKQISGMPLFDVKSNKLVTT